MHHLFIKRCLELAEEGRGNVSPNPLVGCVIVKGGSVITEGVHRSFGGAHAEREALLKAGEFARGATLYINLEPCCTKGKQPPCTDAIISAGITTVVFGAHDPSNSGAEILRKKGIEVIGPVMEMECRRFNRGFFSLIENDRPWVTLKKAMRADGSLDGKITNEEQDIWAHRNLRTMHDAILVGVGTVIADNPQLNIRHQACHPERSRGTTSPHTSWFGSAHHDTSSKTHSLSPSPFSKQKKSAEMINGEIEEERGVPHQSGAGGEVHPRRIILDPRHQIPPDATVMTDADADSTIVITEKMSIPDLLEKLKNESITSLLVEGGPTVWQSFEESGLVDEVVTLTESDPSHT